MNLGKYTYIIFNFYLIKVKGSQNKLAVHITYETVVMPYLNQSKKYITKIKFLKNTPGPKNINNIKQTF